MFSITATRISTLLCMTAGMFVYVNCKSSAVTVNFIGRDMTCESVKGMAIFTGAVDVVNARPDVGIARAPGLKPTADAATDSAYVYYQSDERRTPVTVSYDRTDFTSPDGVSMVDFGTLTFSAGGDQGRALVRVEVALNKATIDDCINPGGISPELYKNCVHAVRDIAIVRRAERNVQMTVYGVCSGSKGVCGKNGVAQTTCVDTNARGNIAVAKNSKTQAAGCKDATITETINAIGDDPVLETTPSSSSSTSSSSGSDMTSTGGSSTSASSSGTSASSTSSSSTSSASSSTSSSSSSSSASSSSSSSTSSSSTSSSSASSSTSSSSSSTSSSSSSGGVPRDGGLVIDGLDGGGVIAAP